VPVVLSLDHVEGPLVGGQVIILNGTDFGLVDNTHVIFIDNVACQTSDWVSDTTARCVTPSGSRTPAAEKQVRITTYLSGTGVSVPTPVYTYNARPVVVESNIPEGPVAGLTPITLTGTSFGTTLNPITITLGSKPCDTSTWLSETTARCVTPGDSSGLKIITLETDYSGITSSAVSLFTYNDRARPPLLSL
jgi:hypothetical protein